MQKDKNIDNVIKFPKKKSKFEREIEAIIFAAEEPLDVEPLKVNKSKIKPKDSNNIDLNKTDQIEDPW